MKFNFFKKSPEPPKPTFRESLAMMAALVATVVATAVAAYKTIILVFEIIYAIPMYATATVSRVWSYVATIPSLPGKALAWVKSLIPTRATTATTETTTTTSTTATGTATTDPATAAA